MWCRARAQRHGGRVAHHGAAWGRKLGRTGQFQSIICQWKEGDGLGAATTRGLPFLKPSRRVGRHQPSQYLPVLLAAPKKVFLVCQRCDTCGDEWGRAGPTEEALVLIKCVKEQG